jgi:hypothetical protein
MSINSVPETFHDILNIYMHFKKEIMKSNTFSAFAREKMEEGSMF